MSEVFSHPGIPEPIPFKSDWRLLKDEAFEIRPEKGETIQAIDSWKPLPKIAEVLQYHSDLGDVQTCACVSLVVGRTLSEVVDESTIAAWQASYLDMLDRLELFVAAAGIRKYSWIKRIKDLSLESTFLNISCLKCARRLTDGECGKCHNQNPECVICEYQLVGEQWMCRSCRHPMHLNEAVQWFEDSSLCPVSGCKCQCKGIGLPNEMHFEPPKPARRRRLSRKPLNNSNTPEEAGIFYLKKISSEKSKRLRSVPKPPPKSAPTKSVPKPPQLISMFVLDQDSEPKPQGFIPMLIFEPGSMIPIPNPTVQRLNPLFGPPKPRIDLKTKLSLLKKGEYTIRLCEHKLPKGVVATSFIPRPPPQNGSAGKESEPECTLGMLDDFNTWVFEFKRENSLDTSNTQ